MTNDSILRHDPRDYSSAEVTVKYESDGTITVTQTSETVYKPFWLC